jgi:prophage regulatory protein
MSTTTYDQLLRLPAVQQATGLSRSTIYRLMAKDGFPRSVQVTDKLVAWWASEVDSWRQRLPRTQRASERVSKIQPVRIAA